MCLTLKQHVERVVDNSFQKSEVFELFDTEPRSLKEYQSIFAGFGVSKIIVENMHQQWRGVILTNRK